MGKKNLILSTKVGELHLFTLEELAEDLKVHVVTLRRYIKKGKLKAIKIGRKYVVTADNLRAFLNPEK